MLKFACDNVENRHRGLPSNRGRVMSNLLCGNARDRFRNARFACNCGALDPDVGDADGAGRRRVRSILYRTDDDLAEGLSIGDAHRVENAVAGLEWQIREREGQELRLGFISVGRRLGAEIPEELNALAEGLREDLDEDVLSRGQDELLVNPA